MGYKVYSIKPLFPNGVFAVLVTVCCVGCAAPRPQVAAPAGRSAYETLKALFASGSRPAPVDMMGVFEGRRSGSTGGEIMGRFVFVGLERASAHCTASGGGEKCLYAGTFDLKGQPPEAACNTALTERLLEPVRFIDGEAVVVWRTDSGAVAERFRVNSGYLIAEARRQKKNGPVGYVYYYRKLSCGE